MHPKPNLTSRFLQLFLLCFLTSIVFFVIMYALQKTGIASLSGLAFICGLTLMLIAYILLALLGSAVLSYLIRATHGSLHCLLSIQERLRRQTRYFYRRRQTLKTHFQARNVHLKQQAKQKRQALYEANTRTQARHLARTITLQLQRHRSDLPVDLVRSTQRAVRHCVRHVDIEGLLKISYSLSNVPNSLEQLISKPGVHSQKPFNE